MSKSFESDINLKGLLEISGSVGLAGQAVFSQGPGLPPVWATPPGTDLTYDAATREVRSSTGADATLPLVTASVAGLASAADKQRIDSAVVSNTTGITGADAVTNIVSLTQAEYNAITSPNATTLYVITD